MKKAPFLIYLFFMCYHSLKKYNVPLFFRNAIFSYSWVRMGKEWVRSPLPKKTRSIFSKQRKYPLGQGGQGIFMKNIFNKSKE